MSLTMYAKKFLALHFAFDEFGLILWGANKPINIVMTDNKALILSFRPNPYHRRFGIFVTKHFSLNLIWRMYQV